MNIKTVFKNTKFSFIMMIITFVIGLIFLYSILFVDGIKASLLLLLIGYFPFIIYFIITFLTNKFYSKKYTKAIYIMLTIMSTILIFIYYIFAMLISVFVMASNPVKSVYKYPLIVKGEYLHQVFPNKIPSSAKNVEFLYNSDGVYSLYYIDSNFDIKKYDSMYKKNSIWIGNIDSYNDEEGLLISVYSDTPIKEENKNDFKIYLVNGRCDDSGFCNHGSYLLTAVNEKTHEVLYKGESW